MFTANESVIDDIKDNDLMLVEERSNLEQMER